MTLNNMVTIRLSAEERLLYEAKAAYRKQSLSAYLRECWDKRDMTYPDFLEKIPQPPSHEQGILLEMLLLLRSIASPEKIRIVQSELKRLKIPVWQGE